MKRISASEKSTYDLLPHLHANRGSITDKVEDVAVTSNGRVYVSTDNDGVDDWNGETWFFSPGLIWDLFDLGVGGWKLGVDNKRRGHSHGVGAHLDASTSRLKWVLVMNG